MLNYDFIASKAKEERIDDVTITREYWQLLFLQRLYLTSGSQDIYFKGGTAIRFILHSFRFSEDLDFTATGKKDRIENLLLSVFDFFSKKSGEDLEFKKEKVYIKFEEESLKYRLLFNIRNSLQKSSIRIDVAFREKPLTREQTVLIPFDYPIAPYPLILQLNSEEIMAEKIRALFVRGKPRDLFDLWFLLTKKIKINQLFIQKKIKLYPELKFNMAILKEKISSYNENELKKELNQFLPENYRNFYKSIKTETLKLVADNSTLHN